MGTQLEEYFDFLAVDDIRLKGHRLGIESVLDEYLHHAQTPEQIAERYPTLRIDQIYATILYYHLNKPLVETYLKTWLDDARVARVQQQLNPSAAVLRIRQLKAEKHRAHHLIA
ncbi:MAG: DUF433 domain-containing protein [Anaerolineae bacterium]|nr:DUF433 domain-containing protein [Anaerolineae bacterium]